MTAKTPLPPEALADEFGAVGPSVDRLRLVGLDHAVRLQAGRVGAAERRIALVEARRPEAKAEIACLKTRLAVERRASAAIAGAVVRAEVEQPKPTAAAAVLHGLLLGDPDTIAAMPTVAAVRTDGSVRRFTCADAKGYFRMDLPAEDAADPSVFLQVSDADQAVLYRGDEAIRATPGTVAYRQIRLSGDRLPPCPVPPDKATMPRLLDLPESAALAVLARLGLELATRSTQAAPGRAGLVVSQEPAAGTPVDASTKVALVIGVAPDADSVVVPNVTGLGRDEAEAKLKEAELTIGDVVEQPSTQEPGTVLAQAPLAGVRAPRGSAVSLTVAVTPRDERIQTPDLVDRTQADAEAALKEAGLGVGRIAFRDDERVGLVVEQDPKAGTRVPPGAAVNLTVGRRASPETARTPDLSGRTIAAAREILAAARLRLGQASGPAGGLVTAQKPAAGDAVPIGSSVDVELGPRGGGGRGPVVRPDPGPAFAGRIATRAAGDSGFAAVGLDEQRLRKTLVEGDVATPDRLNAVVALSNEEIRDMFGLDNLNQARSLRRILRDAGAGEA